MKRLVLILIAFNCITSGIYSQSAASHPSKARVSYQMFEAPTDPAQWDTWRRNLVAYKDSVLRSLKYAGEIYNRKEFEWASKAYATYFLVPNEISLYDKNGNYDIAQCLKKYEEDYGGVDIVVIFPTYPQLGFDSRDQFQFYRPLPGGISGLKSLCDQVHAMGKKIMISYNPWDNIAQKNGRSDDEELLKLVKEIGADGLFLDTISNVDALFDKLQDVQAGAVFQAEIAISKLESLEQVHQSWLELGWYAAFRSTEFSEAPFVVKNRWIEQRHMVYRLSRFSHELSDVIQNAWMNGCGIVLWENIFGTANEFNARDKTLLRAMLPLQRNFSDFFTKGEWTPLNAITLPRVFSSQWKLGNQKLWTLINRQEQLAMGKLFVEDCQPGIKYFDLITGKEAVTVVENNKVSVYTHLRPKGIGCILAIPERELKKEFFTFLKQQAETNRRADFSTSYTIPSPQLKPVAPTPAYKVQRIPSGMKLISVPADTVKMKFSFRQRECGFYPMDRFIDYSYNQVLNETITGNMKFKLAPFAMDETHVTNAQFYKFVKATNYQPSDTINFLKHWTNQKPPKVKENDPVVWITLNDARAYASWAGKRLPTEAEWQWAAQNGEEETLYPWGNTMDSLRCNNGKLGRPDTVKQYKAGRTATGLYDMSGNVWQMTESERNDGYSRFIILRGGAWYINKNSHWYADQGPQNTTFGAKYLLFSPGANRCATVGFRCVVDVELD